MGNDDKKPSAMGRIWQEYAQVLREKIPQSQWTPSLRELMDWKGINPKANRRGRVRPVVLEHLKERFPIEKHPDGFPEPAFVPRKALVKELRNLDPKRLGSLDEWTLDQAIAEYNRLARP
jgi:hypothetical protein